MSDNNTGSNDGDDNTSFGLNGRDGNGSDNGSGTQVYTQFTPAPKHKLYICKM